MVATSTPTLATLQAEAAALPAARQAALRAGDGPRAVALDHRAAELRTLIQAGEVGALHTQIAALEQEQEQVRAERTARKADAEARFAAAEADGVQAREALLAANTARNVAHFDLTFAHTHRQDVDQRLATARAELARLLSADAE